MNNRIIADISNFIFVSDEPEKVDAIFLPGGSHPEQPEYAAELYQQGYAKWLIPSGGISVKADKWNGVRSKADIYNGNYQSDCEFFVDVLLKNGVAASAIIGEDKSGHTRDNAFLLRKVGIDRVLGELARCGNQFVGDIKQYLVG
ncbi:MAG: YdcF family protein [Lachnospiraceae bacterium]|nr:YdcF family protein [Lachnospiraceae bacterium]